MTKPQPTPALSRPGPFPLEVVPAIRATTRPTVVAYGEVRPGVRTQLWQVGGKSCRLRLHLLRGASSTPAMSV
ncbi:MAG: hypothetical protein CM15mP103_07830 [Gammaproteobacteria bacterium]|nr:MAG: hypothetical protein CM15mP103_07830 [Gammaproteobacteria bacterium]